MNKKWLWAWCGLVISAVAAAGIAYQEVAGHKGIREVKTRQKVVALTFDDGPDQETTPRILKILKQYDAKATFFVMGRRAEEFPGQLAQIVYEGHEIGNHGYSHRWLTKLSDEELNEEIAKTEALITPYGPKPLLFRPPGAFYDNRIIETLQTKGYSMVMWSIDSRDWARHDPQGIAAEVVHKVKPGSIILMHDGAYAPKSPDAAALLLERLSKEGYQFVTISELLAYSEP